MKEYSKGIYVKFKPEEVEILHDRMKEAGVQNMSAYIRKMAINGYVIIPEWPDLNRVISLHARISNNLNQYAKKANETGKLYEEDIAEIKMMNNEQTELLKKALEAVIHLYEEDSKRESELIKALAWLCGLSAVRGLGHSPTSKNAPGIYRCTACPICEIVFGE